MRISDWSSDVCSSDLWIGFDRHGIKTTGIVVKAALRIRGEPFDRADERRGRISRRHRKSDQRMTRRGEQQQDHRIDGRARSEAHTSELQSLMRPSYAVFCLNKKQPIELTSYEAHY